MPDSCDPCICPDQHYRDSMSWRKAMITLLCRIAGYTSPSVATPQNGAQSADGIYYNGVLKPFKRAFANVAASQTDSPLVTAVAAKELLILAVAAICGDTPTTLTFNSKPVGAGTAISPLLYNDAAGGEVLPHNPAGWMKTNSGEGVSVTTGAGSSTGIIVTYVEL